MEQRGKMEAEPTAPRLRRDASVAETKESTDCTQDQ